MSVAAAELPELSREVNQREGFVKRAQAGLGAIAFWMMLVSVMYLVAGDLVVGMLFQGGKFSPDDTILVWCVLGAYALGLPATGLSRLLNNVCYAHGDTAGPARIASARVIIAAGIGVVVMFPLDRVMVQAGELLGLGEVWGFAWALSEEQREMSDIVRLGAAGLALGSAVAAWLEFGLLARRVRKHVTGLEVVAPLARLVPCVVVVAVVGLVAKLAMGSASLGSTSLYVEAVVVLAVTVLAYVGAAYVFGIAEVRLLVDPLQKVLKIGRK